MEWADDINYSFWKPIFENQLLWLPLVLGNDFALLVFVWVNMCDHNFMQIKHLFHTWHSKYHKAKVIPNLDSPGCQLVTWSMGDNKASMHWLQQGRNETLSL